MTLPPDVHWLFWEMDPGWLDVEQDALYIIGRILERGRMADVNWLLGTYGQARVHAFLRDVGHPEISPRTLAFWRAYLRAQHESWVNPSAWRRRSSAPWIA